MPEEMLVAPVFSDEQLDTICKYQGTTVEELWDLLFNARNKFRKKGIPPGPATAHMTSEMSHILEMPVDEVRKLYSHLKQKLSKTD